jgi:hypothetical protein
MDDQNAPQDPLQPGPQNPQQSSPQNPQQPGSQNLQQPGPQDPLVVSYLTLRKAVGIIGCALPFVLAIGKMVSQGWGIQSSISMYYYADMRNVFVGSLCAIGIFMMSTRGYDRSDVIAGILASMCALGVALFPTTPDGATNCRVKVIGGMHLGFAAALFLTLAYFSLFLFTKTDPTRTPTPRKLTRNKFYRGCGWTILVCIALMLVDLIPVVKAYFERCKPVFWLESVAVFVFGVSWLIKGETILKDN